MIKKLQRRFVLIVIASLLIVLVALVGSINASNLYQLNQKADGTLRLLSEYDGVFPEFENDELPSKDRRFNIDITEETRYETRYFMIKTDADGEILQVNTEHVAAVSPEEAYKYGKLILKNGRLTGSIGAYKYRVAEKPYGFLITFLDCRSQWDTALSFLLASCTIGIISLIFVSILVSVLSRKAIQPIIDSMEKQKQFITDAGHELKTPLAVISANTEVLELTSGESEWTQSIKSQTRRMNSLIGHLLTLSKMDEMREQTVFSEFDLSGAVADSAEPFKTLAESQGKELVTKIQPGLRLKGDETGLCQLVTILTDNAVKYASENGTVSVILEKSGRIYRLDVVNTVDHMPDIDLNRLFDRFYRADPSRARETGGYGIGLAIAKAIVTTHKGKILAAKEADNTVRFTVLLKAGKRKNA